MSTVEQETYQTRAPNGALIDIPIQVDKFDPYRKLDTAEAVAEYYRTNGYVVLREVIPEHFCREVREAFAKEVKPYPGFIYRQATANPERHKLTKYGFVRNSILNVQDLNSALFPEFKKLSLAVITHHKLQEAVSNLLGEAGKIVQSMYFEGNSATWPHQDTYYLDSEHLGEMVGAWVAVEDIAPGAGRFFVYPGSHKINMQKNGGDFDIAFHHDRYKKLVVDVINQHGLPIHAPSMSAGDVLLWSARTIHGSLDTTQPECSRASLTAHFIPQSHRFLQLQSRVKPLKLHTVNGVSVHHPKPQDIYRNRVVFQLETRFPRVFQAAKRLAVKLVTK